MRQPEVFSRKTPQEVLITAYPKSGSTWLTRLLGDILDSPTGGSMPEEDTADVVTEGQDRPGPYVVRRGHFTLSDDDTGPVVPEPHKLAWKRLTNERVILLIRDPRDICVSGAYHWGVSVPEFLDRMVAGDVAGCGRWDDYHKGWLYLLNGSRIDHSYIITYRTVTQRGIEMMLDCLGLKYDKNRLPEAFERQSFEARAALLGNDKNEMRRNNMRHGVVGDWKDHFTVKMNERIRAEFGGMMGRLQYE